ncbi:hypothetical protein DDB_G0288061 [Dictyostelium discoideum AX4]|uniref:P2X receptor E n=1 Tax=Dictyostelium discoideum TaxID=44689 RepID=P2XE_DICDI|nr:hypothetical protein DDB_G0288061 [Dictyostelium discoideum AX4]Q54JH4.2 RecName: Full=P2X receptor E; Short=P2XE [Dictyostelium discoideum]EAL63456.2 hypothetical protein DDB_G0288061 [Dictyostelium discoideum AX4]|eukprot:XP_636957.2 hypothetical protein DDB_G0288061 [Dictyostelium discoideum AX4]
MNFRNIDWDSLFSYSTIKIVRIRDKRLGILHFAFLIGIILYIIVGTIFLQKKYLVLESPIGSIRTSLMAPSVKPTDLPYCLKNGTDTSYDGYPNKPCQYWDEYLVLYPPSEESSMFITTRCTQETQSTVNGCNLSEPTCVYNTTSSSDFYIANVENFTILLDHTLSAPSLGIQYNGAQLNGQLLDTDGNPMSLPPPNIVGVKGSPDIMSLQGVLTAAGVESLDSQGLANKSRTIRDDGILILCFITYSNTYTYNTGNYHYTYQFKLVQNTKYKIVEPVFTKDVEDRYIFDRHGVRIIFIQTGQLGQFDFQTMLLTFVSGIGLVTAASLIVDIIATRIMPQRSRYQELKFQDSSINNTQKTPTNDHTPLLKDNEDTINENSYQNNSYEK